MVIDKLNTSGKYRLSRVLSILESLYSLTIDFDAATTAELVSIAESCQYTRNKIIEESTFNSYHQNPEYVKAFLINEAIQIFLSEVAPKRIKRRDENPC